MSVENVDLYKRPVQILLLASLLFVIGVVIMALGADTHDVASAADEAVHMGAAWYTGLVLGIAGGVIAAGAFVFVLGKRLFSAAAWRRRDRAAVLLGLAIMPPFVFLLLLLFRGTATFG